MPPSQFSVDQVHTEHIEITKDIVNRFADLSGDHNPIHVDEEYARTTPFGRPIAHGLLTSALISGIVGTRFPGRGTVLLEQSMRYKAPVFVGERVEFTLRVQYVRPDKPIATLACEVRNSNGELASEGTVTLKLPS